MSRTVNIIINEPYERFRPLLESLAARDVPPGARLIYRARNRVYTLGTDDGTQLNIKAFKHPSFPNSLIYTHLRDSKASRSYHNSLRLLSLGLKAATPVGYVEVIDGGRLKASYYVSLQEGGSTIRDWENIPHSNDLIEALARMLVSMHRQGVWHKDFTPGNILYSIGADGSYTFTLLDVNRMRFDVHDRGRLMSNFKAIHLDDDQMLRLARAYARAASLEADRVCAAALKAAEDYRRSKARHRRLKKLIGH